MRYSESLIYSNDESLYQLIISKELNQRKSSSKNIASIMLARREKRISSLKLGQYLFRLPKFSEM
jgi:hypothetical protein